MLDVATLRLTRDVVPFPARTEDETAEGRQTRSTLRAVFPWTLVIPESARADTPPFKTVFDHGLRSIHRC